MKVLLCRPVRVRSWSSSGATNKASTVSRVGGGVWLACLSDTSMTVARQIASGVSATGRWPARASRALAPESPAWSQTTCGSAAALWAVARTPTQLFPDGWLEYEVQSHARCQPFTIHLITISAVRDPPVRGRQASTIDEAHRAVDFGSHQRALPRAFRLRAFRSRELSSCSYGGGPTDEGLWVRRAPGSA